MTEALVTVIDDHDSVRRSMRALLESAGFLVQDYSSAVAYLSDSQAAGDCLLVDLRMPKMSGLELQQELSQRGRKTPMILITGHGDVSQAVAAMRAGAFDFIEKPVDDDMLLAAIQRALTESRAARDKDAAAQASLAVLETLTERENEVFRHLVQGESNKLIAQALDISPRTVEVHRARLQDKLQARGLSDLVRIARSAGLLS